MRVRYLGKSDPLALINGKVYEVISIEKDWYRIIDETREDYLYPPECFEIIDNSEVAHIKGVVPAHNDEVSEIYCTNCGDNLEMQEGFSSYVKKR